MSVSRLANTAVLLALAASLSACGTVADVFDRGSTPAATATTAGGASVSGVNSEFTPQQLQLIGQVLRCPEISIREGTESIVRYAGGREGEASAVRHQLAITRTARECVFGSGTVSVKIGVAGRAVIGPSGTPGTYQAPVRIVVLRGTEVLFSETRTAGATVPAGQGSAEFQLVVENVPIAVESGATGADIKIVVGFDA